MPAFARRQFAGAAVATTLTASINSTDTTCSLAATTGWPSSAGVSFYVVIDPGTSVEEKCLATISGSTLTLTRGQDDTTGANHASGATIYPVFTANDADEANEVAAKLTTKGDLLVTTGSALNRLAVGTNDQVFVADSSATNGVKWGQVSAAGIASDAVTTAKILDANVTEAKLASNAVTAAKIASDAVTTAKILDGNVTAAKLAATAAIQPTIVDAKGDLIVGTAADTVARLAKGTDGYFLKADSAETTGLIWAAVAQAVTAIDLSFISTSQSTSSTSYTDLSTVGPTVTLTTGTSAIVLFGCTYADDGNLDNDGYMSVAVSGASSVSASDTWAPVGNQALNLVQIVQGYKFTGLTAGSNTFTAKYRKSGGTSSASFEKRWLFVVAI